MILDDRLVAPGNEDEILDSRSRASSTTYWISGPVDDRQGHLFGIALVAGRNRVPSPPRGRTACGGDRHGK